MAPRPKKQTDPDTATALAIVEQEKLAEQAPLKMQAEREERIAQCHEIIGRIQGFKLITEFADVGNLVWLKQVKETKIYKDLPGIGTWEKFLEKIGLSRSKVDEDLTNLAVFGEKFLADVGNFSLGYRDLRKLRQLTNDGAMEIVDGQVKIGDELIPLKPDYSEDLQAAFEQLLDAKNQVIQEQAAQIRTQDRLMQTKDQLIHRQEKSLAQYEDAAYKEGLTPAEDAFCRKCINARTSLDGFLMQFDPDRHPLPEDATPRMKAVYMETLGYFRRAIVAAHDTAGDLYGDAEMDDDWVPPHLREEEPVTPEGKDDLGLSLAAARQKRN